MAENNSVINYVFNGSVVLVSVSFEKIDDWLVVFNASYCDKMYDALCEAVKAYLAKNNRQSETAECLEKIALVQSLIEGNKRLTKPRPVIDPETVFGMGFNGGQKNEQ